MHRPNTRLLILILTFLIFIGGSYLVLNNFYASALSVPEESLTAQASETSLAGTPTSLEISSVKISAPIVSVGLTAQGLMESPEGPVNTGWYSLGVSPGEKGSAIIAGHRGFRTGPAVFDNLHLVNTGDEVRIKNAEGQDMIFVVKEKKTYGATEIVPEVWNKTDGKYLNLITCSGQWNRLTGTSDERLVVFTELKT